MPDKTENLEAGGASKFTGRYQDFQIISDQALLA